MNTRAAVRPEERRRGDADGTAWSDTLPGCFRSEAFAEDLPPAPAPVQPRLCRAAGRDPAGGGTAQSAG